MTTNASDQDTAGTVAAVVRLLHHAAQELWARAEQEGPRSHLHGLGLGVHATACEALELVPSGTQVDTTEPVESDPVELLLVAELMTRTIPSTRQPPGLPAVALAISDLIREARDHGR